MFFPCALKRFNTFSFSTSQLAYNVRRNLHVLKSMRNDISIHRCMQILSSVTTLISLRDTIHVGSFNHDTCLHFVPGFRYVGIDNRYFYSPSKQALAMS